MRYCHQATHNICELGEVSRDVLCISKLFIGNRKLRIVPSVRFDVLEDLEVDVRQNAVVAPACKRSGVETFAVARFLLTCLELPFE